MSGHSHAKTVRRVKEANAKKRGQIFSKLARLIWVAVKEKGPNPETNSKLRMAIETARTYNLPKENIERIIKKASGELPGESLEEVIFEAYGPGGIAIIIEGITDNKNRTLGEIKQILNKNNGKLATEGSVKWLFERKGCIVVDTKSLISDLKNKENLEMLAIEAGAEDIRWEGDSLEIYTKIEDVEKTKKDLESRGIKVESASLDWVPKDRIEVSEKDKEFCEKLFEDLDENEAVQEIYSNLQI